MNIYGADLRTIMGPFDAEALGHPPVIGVEGFKGIGGDTTLNIIELEIAYINPNGSLRMTPWVRVHTAVSEGKFSYENIGRLDPAVLRHLLFLGFSPNGCGDLHLAMNKTDLAKILPKFNVANVMDPPQGVWTLPNPPLVLKVLLPTFTAGPKAAVLAYKGVRPDA